MRDKPNRDEPNRTETECETDRDEPSRAETGKSGILRVSSREATLYNEPGKQFEILEKPAIINCKNLDFFVSVPETPPINYITGLRNQNLILNVNNFQVNDLRMLIANWKTSDRPIGTSFCFFSHKNNTNEMFNSLELQDTFPVEIQHDSTDKPGIGIRIDDNRDLVLYHGRHRIGDFNHRALKMKVIASGSEKKNGDTEPDVSA
ncbi:hypothetical protein CRE_17422 [Caenorhabditis remanei]|uniref:F-box associated domain-containing protein n=1 Tax=Caenorhabditis remanei TaxID=31234 RepID=E3N1Z4_CAERE|nr:hypothetical protein CRE_17422 [Caenorhabditis remanei]